MAQAYIRHGSRVTLIELAERVLPRADPEMSQVLHDQLSADGVEILTGSSVETVAQQGDNIMLQLQDGQLIEGDKLLVAIGRRPAVSDLGLEAAGIEYNTQGIIVNSRMQTSRRHIYACGDVTGQMPLTHVAEQQAGVVIANAIFHLPKKMDYRVIPSVVYTEPECAQVGAMTDVAEDDPAVKVVKFGMDSLDRAIADNSTRGFIKLVVRKGRLIGAHVIGQHAGEVIHELALAIQQNMKLSKITTLVHAYPTYSQVNRRVASQYYSGSLFSPATRKLVKFINRWLP
jgi:pyruvate/2-oxoglutarate dehydrogenase complex dihydrolipoamide dehydrogenase (E3) component